MTEYEKETIKEFVKHATVIVAALALVMSVVTYYSKEATKQHCQQLKDQGVEVYMTETFFNVMCHTPRFLPLVVRSHHEP